MSQIIPYLIFQLTLITVFNSKVYCQLNSEDSTIVWLNIAKQNRAWDAYKLVSVVVDEYDNCVVLSSSYCHKKFFNFQPQGVVTQFKHHRYVVYYYSKDFKLLDMFIADDVFWHVQKKFYSSRDSYLRQKHEVTSKLPIINYTLF